MEQIVLAWLAEVRRKLWARWWLWPILLAIAVFQSRLIDWINRGLDLMELQLWQSTKDVIHWLGPFGVGFILFVVALIFIMIRAYFDALRLAPASVPAPVLTGKRGPVRLIGIARNSQISRHGWSDMEMVVAIKLENAEPVRKIIRRFNAFVLSGDSREQIAVESVRSDAPHSGDSRISMDGGLPVDQGISRFHYYVYCYVPEMGEPKGEEFEIEAEILGHDSEIIRVIPNWRYIERGRLPNSVKEIRSVTP